MSSNLNCSDTLQNIYILYHVISGRTALHITTYKDHEGASVGEVLTGYKCETCLGTGKPWSGLGSYNL